MAYEYKKLSEVDVVNSVDSDVNLIVEQNDEIKRMNIGDLPIPTGQVQADWNEEDETKASFIKNKPDLSNVGGSDSGSGSGGEVVIVDAAGSGYGYNATQLKEKFESGALVYIRTVYSGSYGVEYPKHLVISYNYVSERTISGILQPNQITLYYHNGLSGGTSLSVIKIYD